MTDCTLTRRPQVSDTLCWDLCATIRGQVCRRSVCVSSVEQDRLLDLEVAVLDKVVRAAEELGQATAAGPVEPPLNVLRELRGATYEAGLYD